MSQLLDMSQVSSAAQRATAAYPEARKIYDEFIATVRTLIRTKLPDDFGKQTVKPSQLAQLKNDEFIEELDMYAALRGPIYTTSGDKRSIMALSIDTNGNMISEEQFLQECAEKKAKNDAEFEQLQAAVTQTNEKMRALGTRYGLTATDLYQEINRAGAGAVPQTP